MPEPPLITIDGRGRCVGCQRVIRDGESHRAGCAIAERLLAAARPQPDLVVIDPHEIANRLVAEMNSVRELKKRMELDRIASGTPLAQRKRKTKGAAS